MSNITPIIQEYVVDLSSNNNFVQIPAMQGDGSFARYVILELIENGVPYIIPDGVSVYVVGTKPDNKFIFNDCEIIRETEYRSGNTNKVQFEITPQMTATYGRGEYQIMIVDAESNAQLKTFPFTIVTTRAFNATQMVSTNEYQAIVELLEEMQQDYSHYVDECEACVTQAQTAKNSAETSATKASNSETKAKTSETNAKTSETKAKTSETNASASATQSANSATASANSATASASSATTARNKALDAEAWAVGQRNGTDVSSSDVTYHNNSKYWAERAADWSQHDASHLTYTLEDGTQVNLADFLKIIEDLDGETLLLL